MAARNTGLLNNEERMTTTLDAGYVYAMDDGEIVVVGFADREYETQQYVLLQRDKTASRDEQLLGHIIHISVDDQSRSCYGGIRLLEVEADEVRIELDESCARELQTDVSIRIRFSADRARRAHLIEGLKGLFANSLTSLRVESRSISEY